MVPPDDRRGDGGRPHDRARAGARRANSGVSKSAGTTMRRSNRPSASGPSTAALSIRRRPRCAPRLRAARLELGERSGDRRELPEQEDGRAAGPDREQQGHPLPGSAVRRQRRGRLLRRDDQGQRRKRDGMSRRAARAAAARPAAAPAAARAHRPGRRRTARATGRRTASTSSMASARPGHVGEEPGGHDFSAFSSASISAMSASLSRSRSASWATSGVTRPPNIRSISRPDSCGDIIGAGDGGAVEVAPALLLMGEHALGEQPGEHGLDGADAPAALGRHALGDLGGGQRRLAARAPPSPHIRLPRSAPWPPLPFDYMSSHSVAVNGRMNERRSSRGRCRRALQLGEEG